jgi:hypothetical protein
MLLPDIVNTLKCTCSLSIMSSLVGMTLQTESKWSLLAEKLKVEANNNRFGAALEHVWTEPSIEQVTVSGIDLIKVSSS